ncbi:MarR family winged helix-turn-helix transcriptional regulator [Qipengyuania sp.]|uniref:MarR family winged helix-turn-helix transcriptional regulator n=1 Tax=Qipengyuania sp. TaxID=2004515 RepID=UPI0035C84780
MEHNPGYLLADSSRLLRRAFDERVRVLGLTSSQARLLLSLVKFPNRNQAFYADRLEVEPITLTRLIDRMEEAGWIERVSDPRDRRARMLRLTAKSEAIVAELRPRVDGLVADMLAGMTASEAQELTRLLEMVSENLSLERLNAKEATHG